jgi:hypothetical protein
MSNVECHCYGGGLYGHSSYCYEGINLYIESLRKSCEDHNLYAESLRKSSEDHKADADHRALVNADLIRKIESSKKKEEALEMVVSCAQDVIDFWPQFSFKTIRIMVKKMDALKQALELSK